MTETPLTTADDWNRFLRRWSAEWIGVAQAPGAPAHRRFPPDVVDSGWLGRAAASEDAIAAAEARLGVRLPPSYRQFLAVSDGWGRTSPFIDDVFPAGDVGWFRDLNPSWLQVWGEAELDPEDFEALLHGLPVDDDEGDPDVSLDLLLMVRGLQISDRGDSAVLLLDPDDVGPDGEWAGYFFSNWTPGLGARHASFAALMRAEYTSFVRLEQPPGETLRAAAEQTAHARRLLLEGRLDEGLPLLTAARDVGLPTALVLDAQVRLFLGDRPQATSDLHGIFPHGHPELADDPFVAAEIVPVLLAGVGTDYHLDNYRNQNTDTLARLLTERAGRRDAPVPFADPGFDAAAARARALAGAGRPDDAWAELVAALPGWRAASEYALVPVGLVADPVLAPLLRDGHGEAMLRTPRSAELR